MKKSHSVLNRTLFSSLGIYTEYVIGMLVSIVIARHLQPAGFGTYSVIVWMVALGVVLTNSGTSTAAIKFVAELRGGGHEELIPATLAYLRRAQGVFLLVVLVVGTLALLAAGKHVVPEVSHLLLFGFLVPAIAIRSQYMFNIGVSKGFEDFRATAIIVVIASPITLLMVAIAGWLDARLEVFLGIFLVSSVLLYLASRFQVRAMIGDGDARLPIPAELHARIRRHMKLTAMTVTLGFLVGSEVEVLFLKLYSGDDLAGQFKVAFQLANGAALLVPGVFGAILLPMMASALKQGSEVAAQRFVGSTRYLTLLAAPLIAYGVGFANPVIELLYGNAYAPAAPVFAACLAAGALMTITQAGSSLLVSADRQGSLLALVSTLAATKIGLDMLLISRYGLEGAVYAYWVVAILDIIVIMALAIRVSGASPEWGVLVRIGLAATLAALVALPLHHHVVPAISVPLGVVLVSVIYAPLTFVFGCWTRSDINYVRDLHLRLAGGRVPGLAPLLEHAYQHARA